LAEPGAALVFRRLPPFSYRRKQPLCPQHGQPKHDVALVVVSSDDHDPLEADARIYPVADLVDLDRPVADLEETKRKWIAAVTEHRQVASDGLARDVVRRLGQQLQPDFDESNYWVK
jgi:hypothetical protein